MSEMAKLEVGGQIYEFPIVVGSEGERGIDISTLRGKTGLITLDVGYVNTGSCTSSITYIDGEKGILRYRGIPIEGLAEHSSFVETAYLLVHGKLPSPNQLDRFSKLLTEFSLIHEDMLQFFAHFPPASHPMNILASMVNTLAAFYPHVDAQSMTEEVDITAARLISKIRTLAAVAYKKSIGEPMVYPRHDLRYCTNLLHMMFTSPVTAYTADADVVRAIDMLFIMHADHEQNCSTSAVRLVGSSQANLYASISSGITALWGPLHGGANQAVMEMLEHILADGGNVEKYIDMAKDKDNPFRLMGFGHRVYKNHDPRAKLLKNMCRKLLNKGPGSDPLFDIALKLEERALADDYFVSRKLFPNVDFYSGLIYRSIGIPTSMFTVLFAIARTPGWIAQWKEMVSDPDGRIGRPRQIYTGEGARCYIPLPKRTGESTGA
ncbi:MAG: citrate synthase [Lentisphaerae bacterium]|nr:citrate synthase [Lentisphaerota bacterium]